MKAGQIYVAVPQILAALHRDTLVIPEDSPRRAPESSLRPKRGTATKYRAFTEPHLGTEAPTSEPGAMQYSVSVQRQLPWTVRYTVEWRKNHHFGGKQTLLCV